MRMKLGSGAFIFVTRKLRPGAFSFNATGAFSFVSRCCQSTSPASSSPTSGAASLWSLTPPLDCFSSPHFGVWGARCSGRPSRSGAAELGTTADVCEPRLAGIWEGSCSGAWEGRHVGVWEHRRAAVWDGATPPCGNGLEPAGGGWEDALGGGERDEWQGG